MIVKNENPVMRRCLDSVKSIIDYWVIVDTGSTDGTQQTILNQLQSIPGELHESPWINFAHNRNVALRLARNKADYILFIDADEVLETSDAFDKNALDGDFYFAYRTGQKVDCQFILIVNNDPAWIWKDVLHEYLSISHPVYGRILQTLSVNCSAKDGNRSKDPEKALHDAYMLEAAIQNEPKNSRYVFYLAQSYANAQKPDLALQHYQRRISIGGGDRNEIFWSFYCSAALRVSLQEDMQIIVQSYCQAYECDPARAEPVYSLAVYFQSQGLPLIAYLLAKWAASIERPNRSMKIQRWIYDYGALNLQAELAQYLGKSEESISIYRKLLSKNECPPAIKKQIENAVLH